MQSSVILMTRTAYKQKENYWPDSFTNMQPEKEEVCKEKKTYGEEEEEERLHRSK